MTAAVAVFPDADALAWEAAARIAAAATVAVRGRGRFSLALSGGSTPPRLFGLLAMSEWLVRVPWEQTDIFWADERCVPPDHPDSNYGAARTTLLQRLPMPPERVHRWLGESADPTTEATRYASELRSHLDVSPDGMPRIDLVLLGMGADGHTASLFPHSPALSVTDAPTAANDVEKLGAVRLTLTRPTLNAARAVLFLVAGADKAETVVRVLEGPVTPNELPSQSIAPPDGSLVWLLDADAARMLHRTLQ